MFIIMYVLSYIGSGLLLRYAEGATYLAIVQVRDWCACGVHVACTWCACGVHVV